MRKSTEQIFDAPWSVVNYMFIVSSQNDESIGVTSCTKRANQLSYLPELYDALLQATEDACRTCNNEKAEGILDRPCNDLHANECYVAEWRKLLKKVRDCK